MLMVQKQPQFSLSQPPTMFHHRRHPSAPPAVVIVQPTRTPGLLSLSKPQQHRSQRQQPSTLKPSIIKHHFQAPVSAPESPSPAPRGRQPKDKSHSSGSGSLKTSHRQPSPPKPPQSQSKSSQAEGPTTPTSLSTNSDPFLVTSPPSGKLARKRQQQQQPKQHQSPTLSHATASKPNPKPVPILPASKAKPLSLSVPPPRQRQSKQQRAAARHSTNTIAYLRDFPICDDMTEVGDASDTDVAPSPPRTPTRARNPPSHALPSPSPTTYTRGGSAPLFAPPAVLNPAGKSASTRSSGRSHRRAPSEGGVFHMSSDEGSAGEESFSAFKRPVDTQAFLDSLARHSQHRHTVYKSRSSPSKASHGSHSVGLSASAPFMSTFDVHTPVSNAMREKERQLEAQAQQAGYFASSSFQNSPSPEDLPDPLLI